MQRYFAQIEYDGTDYFGFQRQISEQPTIQGEIEKTLAKIFQCTIQITGAGRTDRGVHALGQGISFEVDWQYSNDALQKAINANLPEDIAILQLKKVASSFHPRFDAKSRAYKYVVYNAEARRPLYRHYKWHVRKPLSLERMNKAAALLVGEHDFSTFGSPPQGDNPVREVFTAFWEARDEDIVFFVEANAFLYRMVRSIVGSLKLVGDATWEIEDFEAALRACERQRSGPTAPSNGLYFLSVNYENFEIAN